MEQICDDRFIPVQMPVPRVSSHILQVSAFLFVHWHERFLAVSVEIFTEEVQSRVDALMRVVLAVALELGSILS